MDEKKLQTIAEAVDERWHIAEMTHATKADKAYLDGMLDMLLYFGYEYRVDENDKPILIRS